MPYRADRQDDLLSGERPFDQLRERLDDLLHRKPSSGKFRGGPAVAVGDRFALTLVDPCRAEGEDDAVGRAECVGPGLPRGVHFLQGFVGCRGREVAVEPEMVPHLAVEPQLPARHGRRVGITADRRGDGERIEQDARGVFRHPEFGAGEFSGDVRGEARPEREHPVFVADFHPEGCNFDFGAEFHGVQMYKISYLCSMILKANCKINLGLDILRRRADGFHDLETVMFPVAGLYDEVEVVRTAAPGAEFRAEGLAVDCAPGENICLKAFRLMQRHYGVDGVAIRLGKRVPFGAGLGGGSSDGTAVLLAVNELFALGLSEAELIARAAELGSDTAFFVRNTPQLCKGRGEVMEPFALNLKGMTLVIVKPGEGVSTREAYAGVRPRIPEVPLAERLGRPVAEWQGLVTNDFEEHIFAAHPAIRAAKERLLAEGAVYASMSGSGSAVFGLFAGHEKSERLCSLSPFVFGL